MCATGLQLNLFIELTAEIPASLSYWHAGYWGTGSSEAGCWWHI